MKKLFAILVVVVFAVALGFGQHIDVINQTGPGNQATTVQGFDDVGPGHPGNAAYTDQIGDGNIGNITQFNNGYAGSGELAKIWQQGGWNQAYIQQHTDGHEAFITQYGNDNYAQVNQWGNKTYGSVYENGNGNIGIVNIWGDNTSGPLSGIVIQTGPANKAYQDLGQGVGEKVSNSTFLATQTGQGNFSKQWMQGEGFAGGVTALGNHGTVFQQGNENTADQEMFIWPAGGNDVNNVGSITQYANDNYAKQYMSGMGNTSSILQNGNGNTAVSLQN